MASWGENVRSALDDAEIKKKQRDKRGLMPLEEARRVVAGATEFEREGADRLWAALVSLGDAAEACAALGRLAWRHMPRGRDNTALVERYGAELLPWIEACVDGGVLINAPWCVWPSLLAIEDARALELVWRLDGVRDRVEMAHWEITDDGRAPGDPDAEAAAADAARATWIEAHEELAWPWVIARAEGGDARAVALMSARARRGAGAFVAAMEEHVGEERVAALWAAHGWPTTLTAEAVLAVLDEATAGDWPDFNFGADGRMEYFALRMIAARETDGDGWGVVFERVTGSYPDPFRIERYRVGSGATGRVDEPEEIEIEIAGPEERFEGDVRHVFHGGVVTGPDGEVTLDEAMIQAHDLRPGKVCEVGYWPQRVPILRAYLAENGAPWGDPDEAIELLELEDPEVVVVSEGFQHATGPYERQNAPTGPWQSAPSESPAFRSLAEALVARDALRFQVGEINTDWRRYALIDDPCLMPWSVLRVDRRGGDLPAAIAEAGGPIAIAEVRAIVRGATRFERGIGELRGGTWTWASDRLWAALMSLGDGDELAAAAGALEWVDEPRGPDSKAAVERYGAGILPWLRARIDGDGVLRLVPRTLRANLLALDDAGALDLLLDARGADAGDQARTPVEELAALRREWIAAHPGCGIPRLAARAADGDAAARAILERHALLGFDSVRGRLVEAWDEARADAALAAIGVGRELTARHVLALLDEYAGRPAGDEAAWPRFCFGMSPAVEYGGMRVIGARAAAGDSWAVVIERITGYGGKAQIRRYVYGRGVGAFGWRDELATALDLERVDDGWKGPRGVLTDEEVVVDPPGHTCEAPDYWTPVDHAPAWIDALRGYLAEHPGAFWSEPADVIAAVGLRDAAIVAVSDAFEHAAPSASVAYRSIAEAIATRDARRFEAGTPNTGWKLYAVHDTAAADEDEAGEAEADEDE